jgi:hypothetical protein
LDQAQLLGVGLLAWLAPDWRFARPDAPDYLARIAAYADRHRLDRLCGLDMRRTPHWFGLRAPIRPMARSFIPA